MDELDRMCGRLVQVAKASQPDVLTRPFEIAQIYQALIPYRTNRRELGLETMEEYELALLRLLSGERGYVIADERTRAELRAELESKNPDLSRYRAFATTEISLSPDAVRAFDPAAARRTTGGHAAQAASERPTMGVAGGAAEPGTSAGSAPAEATPASAAAPRPAAAAAAAGSAPAPAASPPASAAPRPPRVTPNTPGRAAAIGTGCRYCGGELPDSRTITFCPHCGQNLTVRQCPACGTELDVAWKFCITCGRSVA